MRTFGFKISINFSDAAFLYSSTELGFAAVYKRYSVLRSCMTPLTRFLYTIFPPLPCQIVCYFLILDFSQFWTTIILYFLLSIENRKIRSELWWAKHLLRIM